MGVTLPPANANAKGLQLVMHEDSKLQAWAQRVDRRKTARVRMTLEGKLFLVDQRLEIDCTVVDLSPGGAGVRCKTVPPRRTNVVLYVAGFGRFEGITTEAIKDGTGIRFECTALKKKRIADQLKLFIQEGFTAATSVRKSKRIHHIAIQSFTRADCDVVECEVIDISLTGSLLKTDVRPPVGEMIRVGRVTGRVVRYHDNGIGVQFVSESQPG